MATFFGSPTSLSHPLARLTPLSSSSQPPNHSSSPPPPSSTPIPQPVSSSQSLSTEQQQPIFAKVQEPKPKNTSTSVESTDWIASTLTRRFGLGAGLAWAGFLAVGVVSEQIKTRLELSQQEADIRDVEKGKESVEVLLPNGIRYTDIRIGGGALPRIGDLVVIDLKGKIEGSEEVFVDTFGGEHRPLALVLGSRPYTKGMCEGIEYVLRTMKTGSKRRVVIPSNLGFGEKGSDLGSGLEIPPFATLEYIVEVDKVSIAPA